MALIGPLIVIFLLVLLATSSLRVLREYQRGVVFQLGRFWKVKGPGLVVLIPGIQQMVRVELRTVVLDVPSQDVISRDNVSVKVNAVVYFRVVDPQKAIIEVENFLMATSQLAQTTLRSVLGKHDLDEMLSQREKLNIDIQQTLDVQTLSWGIKVANVEMKHVDIDPTMIRAIARQAEAERERRAKVIHAEGEMQAAQKLFEAAQVLSGAPLAIQLRYLETLTVIAADKNSTIVFPLPMDIIAPLLKALPKREPSRFRTPAGRDRRFLHDGDEEPTQRRDAFDPARQAVAAPGVELARSIAPQQAPRRGHRRGRDVDRRRAGRGQEHPCCGMGVDADGARALVPRRRGRCRPGRCLRLLHDARVVDASHRQAADLPRTRRRKARCLFANVLPRILRSRSGGVVNVLVDCNGCHTHDPATEFLPSGNPYLRQPPEGPFLGAKQINPATYLGGGQDFGVFPSPNGAVHIVSRNLTPDKTGLPEGGRPLGEFLQILRTGADLDHAHPNCPTNAPQCLLPPFNGDVLQVMPWPSFQHMTERQLVAIYTYLSAVPCLEGGPGEPPNRCQ